MPMGQFTRRVGVTVLLLALAYLLWSGIHVVLLAFAGALFGLFLVTLSEWVQKRLGISYSWALGFVIVGLVNLWAALHYALGARTLRQDLDVLDLDLASGHVGHGAKHRGASGATP